LHQSNAVNTSTIFLYPKKAITKLIMTAFYTHLILLYSGWWKYNCHYHIFLFISNPYVLITVYNIWINYIVNLISKNMDKWINMWEPPTRQTDYSCHYKRVGDIYTPRLSRRYLYPTIHLNISQALANQQCSLVSALPLVRGR
jgi:hypothetical protein